MNDVFGIDLGTTYSAIAYIDDNGQPSIIKNADSVDTTPSVVFFESAHNSVVGQVAKNGAVVESERTVSLIKRQMGSDYETTFDGQRQTPEMISALILKELVTRAREETGIDSNRVVITVPAYFGVREKEATRQAGEIAGLEVVGIVTEPVAAALSYGFKKGQSKTLFVYDLGGGTFDTTIMRTSPNAVEVLVIDGDRKLGGADWDMRLSQLIVEKFRAASGLAEDPMEDDDFRQTVAERTEAAKKSLSARESVPVSLAYGPAKDTVTVTRAEFEEVTRDLLQATLDKVEATLRAAHEKVPDLTIDEVLLVGGSAKMPAVAAALRGTQAWTPKLADPDLAVAKGAAIYGMSPDAVGGDTDAAAAAGEGNRHLLPSAPSVTNVLPKGLGVLFWRPETQSHYVGFLAHRNDTLPIERLHQRAFTADANATEIHIQIFEQGGEVESERPADNIEVTPASGAVFTGLPSLPADSPIDIYLTINHEGLATLEAIEPATGQKLHLEVTMAVMQPEEQRAAMDVIARMTTR